MHSGGEPNNCICGGMHPGYGEFCPKAQQLYIAALEDMVNAFDAILLTLSISGERGLPGGLLKMYHEARDKTPEARKSAILSAVRRFK